VGITVGTCCCRVQDGQLWQTQKGGVEQEKRTSLSPIYHFFLQDLRTSVKFIQDSYLNHLDCFKDFELTSISK